MYWRLFFFSLKKVTNTPDILLLQKLKQKRIKKNHKLHFPLKESRRTGTNQQNYPKNLNKPPISNVPKKYFK
jgi:hypothetical protein